MRTIPAGLFLFFAPIWVDAFKITFYNGERCTAVLGDFVGGRDQGCHQEFAGQANSVVVESTGAVDDNTQVQFFSSSDCSPGTETSVTEDACIGITGAGIGRYGFFQVVDTIVVPPLQFTDDPVDPNLPSIPVKKRNDHSQSHTSVATAQVYHGQTATLDGVQYRWHQVHDGGFTGILPHEWDDNVHVRDTKTIEEIALEAGIVYGSLSEQLEVINRREASTDIEKRDGLQRICKVIDKCVVKGVQTAVSLVINNGPAIESATVKAQAAGKTLWEFLQKPYVVAIVGGSAVNAGTAAISTLFTKGPSTGADRCSTATPTDADIQILRDRLAVELAKNAVLVGDNAALNAENDLLKINLAQLNVGRVTLERRTVSRGSQALTSVIRLNDDDATFTIGANVDDCTGFHSGQLCNQPTGFCATQQFNGRFKWM